MTDLERWLALLGTDGFHVFRIAEDDGTSTDAYLHAGPCDHDCLTRVSRRLVDLRVSMVPRSRRGELDAVMSSSVLWATISGAASVRILERYKPLPAVVLREGATSKRIAVWPLERTLTYEQTLECNRRLAHFLRAPKAASRPETLLPCPGAMVADGRATPVPVVVERWADEIFRAKNVIRGLRPSPDPHARRKAA